MNIEEIKANLWGSPYGKADSSLINAIPYVKYDRITRIIGLTKCELNVLLSVHTVSGVSMRKLLAFIPSLRGAQQTIRSLLVSEYIRQELRRGKSSYDSSRKFYLTGKGKELVRVYYELMAA